MTRLIVSLFVFGLISFSVAANAAAPDPAKTPKDICVKPCHDAATECLNCMKYANENKDLKDVAKECEICHLACLLCHHSVGNKNPRAWETCELCEKVCIDCAALCETKAGSDEHLKKCAKVCRDCAKACADARK